MFKRKKRVVIHGFARSYALVARKTSLFAVVGLCPTHRTKPWLIDSGHYTGYWCLSAEGDGTLCPMYRNLAEDRWEYKRVRIQLQ